ncbi:MAG: hypothetical protein ACK5AK_11070 [Gemmatimonas sp.]|jgi:hypothetical protein
MSLEMLAKTVAGVLALSAGLAFTPVGAQTSTTNDLVTTDCGAGHITECGKKAIQTTCNFSISLQPSPTSAWGFSLSFGTCTGQGYMNIYKDFRRHTASGTCVQTQKFPADATSTGKDDGSDAAPDGLSGEGSSC